MIHSPVSFPFVRLSPEGLPGHIPPARYAAPPPSGRGNGQHRAELMLKRGVLRRGQRGRETQNLGLG